MQTKLTLRLDDSLIRRAKAYAAANGKSVSQIVADFFVALDAANEASARNDAEVPPITRSLRGVLKTSTVKEDDYYRYLEEKHR